MSHTQFQGHRVHRARRVHKGLWVQRDQQGPRASLVPQEPQVDLATMAQEPQDPQGDLATMAQEPQDPQVDLATMA